MRYIRTENGRIVDRLSDFNCFKSHGTTGRFIVDTLEDDNNLELWLQYNRTSIVKQGDTIEELCDGLIVEQKDKPNIWFTMEVKEFINEKEHLKDWSYKAFIKTDKGLIYIAEMNDQGELCLL